MDSSRVRQPLNGFLNLAPATSGSYPQKPQQQQPQQPEQQQQQAAAVEAAPQPGTASRSSSVSSTVSNGGSGLRFLKLGPVHYGEHPDADKDDWSAVVE